MRLKKQLERKKEAYMRTVERNIPKEVKEKRKREYIECKKNVKRVIVRGRCMKTGEKN